MDTFGYQPEKHAAPGDVTQEAGYPATEMRQEVNHGHLEAQHKPAERKYEIDKPNIPLVTQPAIDKQPTSRSNTGASATGPRKNKNAAPRGHASGGAGVRSDNLNTETAGDRMEKFAGAGKNVFRNSDYRDYLFDSDSDSENDMNYEQYRVNFAGDTDFTEGKRRSEYVSL